MGRIHPDSALDRPLVFEIGQNRAKELHLTGDKDTDELFKVFEKQALMSAEKRSEATDTMIEEVQSIHQGAFSYLWEQPTVRALLLPSGGILAALIQYLHR